ncbi:hypothetical protein LCGC14_2861800, partial [marine sediment metagenome]
PLELSDELLNQLLDAKLGEQLSWDELTERYEELTGKHVAHNSLKSAMLRDAPARLVPGRVGARIRETVELLWENVDTMQLMLYMVNGTFIEWTLMHDRRVRHLIDDEVGWAEKDQERLDRLWAQLTGFFFQLSSLMKETSPDSMPSFGLLIQAGGKVEVSAAAAGGDIKVIVEQALAEVGDKTRLMLEGVNNKHREEGRGHYRPPIEGEFEQSDGE